MVEPRVLSLPHSVPYEKALKGLGGEAIDLCSQAGLILDEWQQFVLVNSLIQEKDLWTAFEIGVNVSRQNGKGGILEARQLTGLFIIGERLQIHSAHQFDTSLEHFRRLLDLIEDTPDLDRQVKRVSRSHGEEGIELKDNRRIRFRTRTKGGGRGFSGDVLYLDEAMVLSEFMHGALLPTLSARPNPQVWYSGSAVDQLIHEHGVVFSRIRERGMKGDPGLAYFEWSVDADGPDEVGISTFTDQEAWEQANPALGIRITPEHVALEQRSMDPRTFAVERLGVGDWPRTDHVAINPIDFGTWVELHDEKSVLQDPACFAFDTSPDRRSSISAAGKNQRGEFHLELIASRPGTGWVASEVVRLVKEHKPIKVVCDGYGPAASLVAELHELGIEVETLSAGDHAQACGRMVDVIEQGTLRHRGGEPLDTAVRSARTRPLGDAWAWSRKNSSVNISPLVSATLALSAAMTAEKPRKVAYAFA